MPRSILMVLVVVLATLVVAPAAVAQMDDNPGADDRMGEDRGLDDNPSFDDRVGDDRGFDDDVVASPMSSSTPTANATPSASVTSSASDGPTTGATALPRTGGVPLVPLLSAAALASLVASGFVAALLIRRIS
jgi:hypothetical protein